MASLGAENVVSASPICQWFKGLHDKLSSNLIEMASEAKKLGQEDPRRIIHSLKVGLAISLVSLFYYFDPLYEGFGISAIWAVITVVVVFEFTVGMSPSFLKPPLSHSYILSFLYLIEIKVNVKIKRNINVNGRWH